MLEISYQFYLNQTIAMWAFLYISILYAQYTLFLKWLVVSAIQREKPELTFWTNSIYGEI